MEAASFLLAFLPIKRYSGQPDPLFLAGNAPIIKTLTIFFIKN